MAARLPDARQGGETERRLHAVVAWRETPFFTPRERAALAWTEAVTEISTRGAPDDLYAALAARFTPKEQMDLTLAISMINGWNRLAISFHKMPDA
jgi:alkylhydroperoxidase family enzyme